MNAVSKAPTDVVALVVATSRQVLIFDSVVAVKRIVDAPTKAARWNHHLDDVRVKAGSLFRARAAL